MINEENKEEIIEQYLEGALTGEELQEFEAKMATDAAFRREVALQRKIVRNVHTVGREQLRAQLKDIHQEMLAGQDTKEETKVVPLLQRKAVQYAIAAAIALLIVGWGVFMLLDQPSDEPVLAFLPVESIREDGSRGPSRGMLNVLIYPPEDTLNQHYQFTDTLKLYGPFDAQEIRIVYNLSNDHYMLEANGKTYGLRKTTAIMRLEEED